MSAVKKNKARKDSRDQQGQEGTGLNFKKYVQMHMHDTLMYFKQVKCLIIKKTIELFDLIFIFTYKLHTCTIAILK